MQNFLKSQSCRKNYKKKEAVRTELSENQEDKRIDITLLDNGFSAQVVEIKGGSEVTRKLHSMGIIKGITITRKNGSFMKGPVVLQKGSMQIALGYNLAKKIIVQNID